MARINLLPWRENLRAEQQREFLVMAGGTVVITLLLGLYTHLHINGMITDQEERNAFLQREITALDERIEEIKELEKTKARLLARMEVIQELQSSRPEAVHLFDELVKTTPDGAFLTKIKQQGKMVELDGRAQSNARVSAYMRNVEGSDWIGTPVLQVIENKDKTGTGFSHFTMSVQQQAKQAEAGKGDVK
jgi:type IV pilus assembly protein PilN